MDRRQFLLGGTLAAASTAVGHLPSPARTDPPLPPETWDDVRGLFDLRADLIHMGGLYLASHPAPVREAIDRHRRGLDESPVDYLQRNGDRLEDAVRRSAASYLGLGPENVALTDSTTMGLGLLYNGLDLRPGDDILTTTHDYYATHEALRLKAERVRASLRQVALYDRPAAASADEMVARLMRAVRRETRLVAVTWVHSGTGVKLPIAAMAQAVDEVNRDRRVADRIVLSVDGVHALGVESTSFADLGCDFLVAGCHKWLFGPRGTGVIVGRSSAWSRVTPTIPTFSDRRTPGGLMSPGGFHSFEHRWALSEAFDLHSAVGKERIAARIEALASEMKSGLAAMRHVTLHTPVDPTVSAGIVCFEVDGLAPRAVVERLRRRGIVATTTPYQTTYARLAPGLLNSPSEVEAVLAAVQALA